MAVDPHPDLGWRSLYTGGEVLCRNTRPHNANQQAVDLAVDSSSDEENGDQAEVGAFWIDEFDLDDGTGLELSFHRELGRLGLVQVV